MTPPVVTIGLNDEAEADQQKCKSYFFSPKEWRAVVVLMVFVIGARMQSTYNWLGPELQLLHPENKDSMFRDVDSFINLKEKMTYLYCETDLNLMCKPLSTEIDFSKNCVPRFSPPLARLWGITRDSQYECSLNALDHLFVRRFQNLDWKSLEPGTYPSTTPRTSHNVTHEVQLDFERLLVYSWIRMAERMRDATSKERQGMVAFYSEQIYNFVFLLGTDRDYFYFDKNHSKEDIMDMMLLSLEWIGDMNLLHQMNISLPDKFESFRVVAQNGLYAFENKTRNGDDHVRPRSEDSPFFYKIFFYGNACMSRHYEFDHFITDRCNSAMEEIPLVVRGLELMDECKKLSPREFMTLGLFLPWFFFALYRLQGDKERIKQMMDRRRQSLQAELEDPVLREALLSRLPTDARDGFVERRLGLLADWDSKASAVRLLRTKTRRLRITVIIFTTVCSGYAILLNWFGCPMTSYLDTVIVALVPFLLSYRLPLRDEPGDAPDDDTAVEMNSGESTRPLLLTSLTEVDNNNDGND